MQEFLEEIRTHFNIIHLEDSLSLTLINPNLSLEIIKEMKSQFRMMDHLKKMEIVIIESVNFDDQLLIVLAEALPEELTELSLDFTGCESLRGSGFLDLFERISVMPLTKLKLDLSQVYDINDLVIEGLTMLLESLDLEELYLDFYQIDQITQDGYMLLAESLSECHHLKTLYIDLSANVNLTEDALQILFSNFKKDLTSLTFKIVDIDQIGGGSFFKLGESLSQMQSLTNLNLKIASFTNVNQKGIYCIIKNISTLKELTTLELNFSNINLKQKILSYLELSSKLKQLTLDISCNRQITDRDILNLAVKLKNIVKCTLNFDFCDKITEDSISEVVETLTVNQKCQEIVFQERQYSQQFVKEVIEKCFQNQALLKLELEEKEKEKKALKIFQKYLQRKITYLQMILQCKKVNLDLNLMIKVEKMLNS